MDFLADISIIAFVILIGAVSPGPDFFLVMRNSLVYSRRAGLCTALGSSLGAIVHVTYTLFGIGLLIANDPFLYQFIKIAGVSYLFYIGICSLRSSFQNAKKIDFKYEKAAADLSPLQATSQGFLTNLLNPKIFLFFISFFPQFIDVDTPLYVSLSYAAVTFFVSLFWFSSLAYFLSSSTMSGKLSPFRFYIDRMMGTVLILLGFRILLV